MKMLGDRSIASLLRRVLDAAWWLGIVSFGLLTCLLLVSFAGNLDGGNLTMDLPVALELDASAQGSVDGPTHAQIGQVRGNLRFPVQSGPFFAGSMLLIVIFFGFLLWGLAQLRRLFGSLSRGQLFIPENARRIRRVGLTVIVGEVGRAAVVYFWSSYTSLHFTANGMRFVASADFNFPAIVSGLAILVIAEVFREGTRLHEEQSLTI